MPVIHRDESKKGPSAYDRVIKSSSEELWCQYWENAHRGNIKKEQSTEKKGDFKVEIPPRQREELQIAEKEGR